MKAEAKHLRPPQGEKRTVAAADASVGKEAAALRTGYLHLFIRIVLLALLGLLLFTKVFLITQASGNEMFPAIRDGDLLLAFRAQRGFGKNDVVIYTDGQKRAVGRIAAAEGDVVMLDDSGVLSVNGTVQSGEILFPTYAKEALSYPYRLPAGTVFLLGDCRSTAHDSRELGAISVEAVEGKVITILRRRGI